MKLAIYQIDAFARGAFSGNPAAVVPLDTWLTDQTMQAIAEENNLSETAFFVQNENGSFHIRWFTPKVEVRLCGHATLASAHVIFNELGYEDSKIKFTSLSGDLFVSKKDDLLSLDFPSDTANPIDMDPGLHDALGLTVLELYRGRDDYLALVDDGEKLAACSPDFAALAKLDARGIIVTAVSHDPKFDFISRGFFPRTGINEDPATGSAHTILTPFWSKRLSKTKMQACQWSERKGYLNVEHAGQRCFISGHTHAYLTGHIWV